MSARALQWAWHAKDVSAGALLVLLALADHADDEGVCYPSTRKIGELARQSSRSVQRQLNELESLGLITREERFADDGDQLTTLYRLKVKAS